MSSRSPTIVLFNLACHFKISFSPWKNILLKPKSYWEFISSSLIFAPIWNTDIPPDLLELLVNWMTSAWKEGWSWGGWWRSGGINPACSTDLWGEMFTSRGTAAAASAVKFSLWLCPPVALMAERPASSSHPTLQGRGLCWSTLESICVWLRFLTSAMGLCSTTLSYCVLWEFIQ